MIQDIQKQDCCGCSACVSVCPQNCLAMIPDIEGFLYPSLIEPDNCVECGICIITCPCIEGYSVRETEQIGLLVQNRDRQICMQSTSGGAFSAIAQWALKKNGVVFGVSLNKDFKAIVQGISNENDLSLFRNSKYVQSDPKGAFENVKALLKSGQHVCYSGTPCQIEGLKKYLFNDYENLLTVDVVCRAVPSPMVWGKYLEVQRKKINEDFGRVKFRDKSIYGYQYSNISIRDLNDNVIYNNGVESDAMLRAFFSGICNRPSCYSCKFKKRYRMSDITIWDCFDIDRFNTDLQKEFGVTKVLIHTPKGVKAVDEISDFVYCQRVSVEKLIQGADELLESTNKHPLREMFINDLVSKDPELVFNEYFPLSLNIKVKRVLRRMLAKMNLTSKVKLLMVKLGF